MKNPPLEKAKTKNIFVFRENPTPGKSEMKDKGI